MSVRYAGLRFDRPGHATVRIERDDGHVTYLDPWREVLDGAPGDADVAFVTHDDYDHYDPDGIAAVAGPDTVVAAFERLDTTALPRRVVTLHHEGVTTVDGVTARTLPAHNQTDGDHVDGDGTPYHAVGEGVSLVLTIDGTTVFYPSDTDVLPHHRDLSVDVLVPPIGGTFTMDRHQAADLARDVEPSLVLPVHYDTFERIEADAAAFVDEVRAAGIDASAF